MPTADVFGSKMYYREVGEGDSIVFLHGNPTSSYLWRKIILNVCYDAHVIAPDLIGMGYSDKPKLDYTFDDHAKYLDELLRQLDLHNVTLVLHDWGGPLGLHWASHNSERVKSVVFMETMVREPNMKDLGQPFRTIFRAFRMPGVGFFLNQVMNFFVNQVLPKGIQRKLTKEELDHYRGPYPTISSRKPVKKWPQQIPFDGYPAAVAKVIRSNLEWLMNSDLPKLHLYATPGALMPRREVDWCRDNLKNLTQVHVGEGLHFIQEDCPDAIGQALYDWIKVKHPAGATK